MRSDADRDKRPIEEPEQQFSGPVPRRSHPRDLVAAHGPSSPAHGSLPKALRASRKAAAFFDSQPPGYRRTAIHWVISAKRPETRERRLAQLIADSAAGRKIGPLARPVKAKSANQD